MTVTNRPIRRALVSVYDKTGIEELAQAFVEASTEVVSTGFTAEWLMSLGVSVTSVEQVTGFPESLPGQVKTLDPHIHGGILAHMTDPDLPSELATLGIKPFDLAAVNMYPFSDTVRSGANHANVIKRIDIGGPSMIRAAAKNSASVAVVCDQVGDAKSAERLGKNP
jgi:phosphoribosylaminoimidazolecarboxamide formyltransferase / IMP cyclohydrolase